MQACKKQQAPGEGFTPPPMEVAVVTMEGRSIPVEYEFTGETQARRTVEIRARVSGFLKARYFEEGKPVREGDLLFEIDPRVFEAEVEIARARLAKAEAREKLAFLEAARFEQAVASGAASRREVDQAQSEVADAKASVNLARAELAKAELDLSYTKVHSPVSGMIGRAMKDEGSYLSPGEHGLLAVAMQTDPMYVMFPISEREWLKWREDVEKGVVRTTYTMPDGSAPDVHAPTPPVSISLLDGKPYAVEGRLDFFDASVDSKTGSAMARASFENKSGALKPGQFVRASIRGWERPNSMVVPQRAVLHTPAGTFVMLVDPSDTVEIRPVVVGEWKGDGWLILSGLKPGERVMADGFVKAPPGSKVKPVPYIANEKSNGAGASVGGSGFEK